MTTNEKPITRADLAEALECFWNAAMGAANNRQDYTATATIGCMVEGVAAVAQRLREQVTEAPNDDITAAVIRSLEKDFIEPVAEARPWELHPVQALPQYWKRKYNNGGIQYAVKQLHFIDMAVGIDWVQKHNPSEVEEAKIGWSDTAPCFESNIWSGAWPWLEPARLEPKHVPALENSTLTARLVEALRPLVDIANAYDANELEDEARKHWGGEVPMTNTTPPDKIELYTGRGGRTLLTLQHCLDARNAFMKLGGRP